VLTALLRLDTIAIIALRLIALLIPGAITILPVSILLWTVAVTIGLVLFPWFFFSWLFLRRRFRLVLVVLALHRECGGAEKQKQGRGCYQQLHFV